MEMNTRKNNNTQSIVGPQLALVSNSVHTQSSVETGMSLILCPFKSVAKLSIEYRIRHIDLDSREDQRTYVLLLSALNYLECSQTLGVWCFRDLYSN